MQKKNGAILLVAGTCIGSGMLALPMTFARIGVIPSIVLMIMMWGIIYYSALLSLELNLQNGKAANLGQLAKKFSGPIAQTIGTSSFKILSFALVVVYLYAITSLTQEKYDLPSGDFYKIAAIISFVGAMILALPIKIIDYVNRFLFSGLILVILVLVLGLIAKINWSNIPLFGKDFQNISAWIFVAPIAFTAFGFHGSISTIIGYCDNNEKMLKQVFLWGCFIPSIVYILWTVSVLSVINNENSQLYARMVTEKIEVGELVEALISIVKTHAVQNMIWWISLLAITTSLLGVGISLRESLQEKMENLCSSPFLRQIIAAFSAVAPAYFMAIWIPNAFIKVLGFAGMILVVIAIILPIYLFKKLAPKKIFCYELKKTHLVNSLGLLGLVIILCELMVYL